jgi:Fur family zinc uptake transcriptional regulator
MKTADLTKNEKKVLSALGRSMRPLSAYEILDRARSDALKAPVQVYRALEKLSSRGLVHRIEAMNAFVACTDCSHPGHDHASQSNPHARHRPGFVICRDCGTVREFEDERLEGIATEAAGKDFAVDFVSLEVYGRCVACAA